MEILGFALAIAMGLILGLLGGGGSILTVPILVYIMELPATLATGYSLFIVAVVSSVGFLRYFRQGLVDFRVGVLFAISSMVGAYLVRRYLIPSIPEFLWQGHGYTLTRDIFILVVLSLVMLKASISMIRGRVLPEEKPVLKPSSLLVRGFIIGGVTGFVGAGGGFLIVPALLFYAGLEMKKAVAVSLMIIMINSTSGFLGDVQNIAEVDWKFLLSFSALGVIGILMGSQLAPKVPAKRLKALFGYFVLAMSLVIFFREVL